MIADQFPELFRKLVGYAVNRGCRDPEAFAAEAVAKGLVAEGQGKTIEPGYLFRTLHNLIVDDVRRTDGRDTIAIDDDGIAARFCPLVDDFSPDVADALEAERLLAAMTPAQAETIRLRAEGYRLKEVAELVGRSEDAVKKLIARGWRNARRAA